MEAVTVARLEEKQIILNVSSEKNSYKVIPSPSQIWSKVSSFIRSVFPLKNVESVDIGTPDI